MNTSGKKSAASIKLSDLSGGQKALYFVGLLAVLAVLGPLAAMAAATVTSLATAALYGAGLFVLWVMFPFISRFLKTMSLKLMKANARMNPIETLELDFMKKQASLQNFVKFVTSMMAAHRVSQDELDGLKKEFPDRDLSSRQEMVNKMGQAVKVLRDKATEAEDKLDRYDEEVRFIKADHQWASRFAGAMTQLKGVQGVDALDELLKNEAVGQVRQDVATAFAELDMLLAQDDTKAAFQIAKGADPKMIELTALELPQLQPAGR